MKKTLLLLIILLLTTFVIVNAQTVQLDPQPQTVTVKKIVKIGEKFYIETSQTTKNYQTLTKELLFDVENDEINLIREDEEKQRIIELNIQKKEDRIERNRLLKDAIKKGYIPEAATLEEIEKIEKIKTKIGVKK